MRPITTLAFGLAFCMAGTAIAQAPATDQPAPKPAKVKRVCRSMPKTGSRLNDTVCHTQSEWDEIARTTPVVDRDQTAIAPH